jgi:hypothetical protein
MCFLQKTALLGWLGLLSCYWAINGALFLSNPEQNWGEVGFEATSIFTSWACFEILET